MIRKGEHEMKKRMLSIMKKAIVAIVAIALVITTAPPAAFAETKDPGDERIKVEYYDSTKSRIKSIDLNDWHYYDVSNEVGTTLDDNTLKEIVSKYLLPDWSHVASGIFDSESVADHFMTFTSGPTWNGSSHNWDWWYDNKSDVNELRINLADWLKNPGKDYRYDKNSTLKYPSCTQSTDVSLATNLGQAREKMAAEIDDCIDPVSPVNASKILNSRDGGALSAMKKDEDTKAVYKIVTSMDYAAPMETDVYYNSYGICFYDFSLDVVMDDDLEYTNSKYVPSSEPNKPEYTTTHIKDNETTVTEPYSVTYDRSDTQTLMNSIQASNTLTIGGEIGGEIGGSFKIFGTGVDAKINGHLNAQEAMQTAYGKEKSTSYTDDRGTTSGVDVHPHTRYSTSHQDTDVTDKIVYDCPVVLNYKVAIFSISGSVRVVTGVFGTRGDFFTDFGYKNTDGGTNAPANLKKRTESADYEKTYGTTEGYYKGEKTIDHLDWDHVKGGINKKSVHKQDREDAINKIKGELPLLSSGASMDVINKGTYEDDNPLQPLYQLMEIKFNTGYDKLHDYQSEEEYALHINDSIELGGLTIQGFDHESDKIPVPYEGFDPNRGRWILCDQNGNAIDASEEDPIRLTVNGKKNQVTVKGQHEGVGYITWVLDDDVKYKAVNGQTVTSKNPPSYPMLTFNVSKIDPDVSAYSVKVYDTKNNLLPPAPEAGLAVCANEKINLNTHLRAKVLKGNDVVAYTTTYELTDPFADATIDENGNFVAKEDGNYGVRAVYHYKGTDEIEPVDLKSEEFIIEAKPERELSKIEVGYDDPDGEAFTGKVSPKVPQITYDIASHRRFFDQYGDPWGKESWQKKPKINLEVTEGTELDPEIIEDSLFRVTKGGKYVVKAKAVEDGDVTTGDSEDLTAFINFNIDEIKGIDKPVANEGLVYNGKEQVGVKDGEGYFLTGSTGINAGKYDAVVRLEPGYMWNDLTEDPFVLNFEIAKAPNKLSVKGKNTKIKIKKLKKKSQKLAASKIIKITEKGQGEMSYQLTSAKKGKKSFKKYFKINKTSGKLTIKKNSKMKKGTYTVKVKVNAAGNTNYNGSAWKTVTIKIKMK